MIARTTAGIGRRELILGGQRSGKSRRAEGLVQAWLGASVTHNALLIATAQAGDPEMRQRIARHQADRVLRLARLHTVEEPLALAAAITTYSTTQTLVLVDCLTLWLTNHLMPAPALADQAALATCVPVQGLPAPCVALLTAIEQMPGPLVVVSNEIGLGVIPMGAQVRAFVDTLGQLNQAVATVCERVTLMAAGLPLILKDQA